uniref:Uncharacterized protein n=1 Tax=Pristionchus pacificus TaxID=54126 RepID=A0A8R1UKL2_PRIPA
MPRILTSCLARGPPALLVLFRFLFVGEAVICAAAATAATAAGAGGVTTSGLLSHEPVGLANQPAKSGIKPGMLEQQHDRSELVDRSVWAESAYLNGMMKLYMPLLVRVAARITAGFFQVAWVAMGDGLCEQGWNM